MKIYRYSSGNMLRSRLDGMRPELNAFFMPPDNMRDYPDPCIGYCSNCIREEDPDATRQYQRFDSTFMSNLDTRGFDEFVISQLQDLRWIFADDVPKLLKEHHIVKSDKHPHKSQWFVADVAEDYIQQLEARVEQRLRESREMGVPTSSSLLPLAIILILGILIGLVYIYHHM